MAKWVVLITAIIYILPYLVLGTNVYIRLHDNLEGEWIWLKVLRDSHLAYTLNPYSIVPQVMKGMPRSVYPTGLSVNMFLVELLGTFRAYIASSFLVRIIGFIGMTLLLKDYFIRERESRYIVWMCALSFSVLSLFIPFGISLMGQPLLLWAFLNLHSNQRLRISYLTIILFPLYSSVVWLLLPFGTLLFVTGIYFWHKSTLNKHYVTGVFLLGVVFIIVNLPIISTEFIHGDFIPHRNAYNLYMFDKPDITGAVGEALIEFFIAHYHAATILSTVYLVSLLLVIRRNTPLIRAIFIGITCICLFQGFYSYGEYWLGGESELLKSFRFNRFQMLLPFLWMLVFALSLYKMKDSRVLKSFVVPFLFISLVLALFGNDELFLNYRTLTGHQKFPGFENYMAPRQFEDIKQYIAKPVNSYYVASFGLSPTIAQYNGFYTLDGLMSVYDLRYKEQFRKIFAGEIEKSKDIKQYFDGWGNRCYIYSSELGILHPAYNCDKYTPRSVEHFDFNAKAFADLGGRYLISAVNIKNAEQQHLHLEGIFNDNTSWWTIYLYSVNPGGI